MTYKGKKKKRYKGKTRSSIKHFRRRMEERYEIWLSDEDLLAITNIIQQNKSISSEKQSNRITIHTIIYNNQRMRVVYDKERNVPVTCLYIKESSKK